MKWMYVDPWVLVAIAVAAFVSLIVLIVVTARDRRW